MSEMVLKCPFEFGERVIIDGDDSLLARVVQVAFKTEIAECEISYVHCGDVKTIWIANWRLSPGYGVCGAFVPSRRISVLPQDARLKFEQLEAEICGVENETLRENMLHTLSKGRMFVADEIERLRDLVETLIDNDPSAPIADNGMTVLDGWRKRARATLSSGERTK